MVQLRLLSFLLILILIWRSQESLISPFVQILFIVWLSWQIRVRIVTKGFLLKFFFALIRGEGRTVLITGKEDRFLLSIS